MKREILCLQCAKTVQRVILPSEPGEYCKFVAGKTLSDFVCDSCNERIPKGTDCEALSMWSDRIPYSEWERYFVG